MGAQGTKSIINVIFMWADTEYIYRGREIIADLTAKLLQKREEIMMLKNKVENLEKLKKKSNDCVFVCSV